MLLEVNLNSINLSKISKMTKKQITELSYQIVGHAITVHKQLGPGLLESVYEECLKYELEKHGHLVRQQINVPVVYDELFMDVDLRLDLLVDNLIVVELKAVENVLPVHEAQLITYLKLLEKPQGLLINFYAENITKSMKPFVSEHFRDLPEFSKIEIKTNQYMLLSIFIQVAVCLCASIYTVSWQNIGQLSDNPFKDSNAGRYFYLGLEGSDDLNYSILA